MLDEVGEQLLLLGLGPLRAVELDDRLEVVGQALAGVGARARTQAVSES